ncbi:ESPR domain-containing protein [Gallibacterium melopsittaci]|uniref:ESPR domain-containing protein n=1 Tax=Gallibacterium melopsittaci TaxID=516063 RepID=A0ABV6HZH6_9PAST
MNHIFRVIFDHTKGIWVAVSELTKAHGKTKSEKTTRSVSNVNGGGIYAVRKR